MLGLYFVVLGLASLAGSIAGLFVFETPVSSTYSDQLYIARMWGAISRQAIILVLGVLIFRGAGKFAERA